ncbi:MAG: hypothetical protein Q8S54_10815 [Bacteroidota bacterium]|nr:hypothetical protein [Odoribacter sp.]MDP3643666.1 hypothetical protein [Bacteroidota bacterium]
MNFLEHFDHPERKQDKEHFSHLIQMAMADGILENAELEMLYQLGSKLGITTAEVDDLLEINKKSAYIPPYELSKRFGQLYDVLKMVYADGKIDDNEMRLATGIALKSGFLEEELPVLLALLINGIRNGDDEDDLFILYKKRRLAR